MPVQRICLLRSPAEAVDGKSILSVLTLAAEQGTQLTLRADGDDAEAAMAALEALFVSGFEGAGEEVEEKTGADGSTANGPS